MWQMERLPTERTFSNGVQTRQQIMIRSELFLAEMDISRFTRCLQVELLMYWMCQAKRRITELILLFIRIMAAQISSLSLSHRETEHLP